MIPLTLQQNLYCIDLSCYGVPSPLIFRKYLIYQEEQNGPIEKVIIRDKKLGRRSFRVGYGVKFTSGRKYFATHGEDPMARIFYSHIALRPSCYECPFKTIGRISDLTLGDCWYPDFFIKGFNDKYGITMILQHSEKGNWLLKEARSLKLFTCEPEKLIKVNGGMLFKSSPIPENRGKFWEAVQSGMDFQNLADKFSPAHRDTMRYKIMRELKEIGVIPQLLQRKKREKEVQRRCKLIIDSYARIKYE